MGEILQWPVIRTVAPKSIIFKYYICLFYDIRGLTISVFTYETFHMGEILQWWLKRKHAWPPKFWHQFNIIYRCKNIHKSIIRKRREGTSWEKLKSHTNSHCLPEADTVNTAVCEPNVFLPCFVLFIYTEANITLFHPCILRPIISCLLFCTYWSCFPWP